MDILGGVGDVLDTPGRFTRTALAGRNPFATVFDPSKGVSGRDLLQQYGMVGENQDGLDGGDIGGFLAEMALDPTNLIGGGLLARLIQKSKPNWFHATNRAGVAADTLRPSTGRALKEPKAVYFASSPNEAIRSTGKAADQVIPARIDPRSVIAKDSQEYEAAWAKALSESEQQARHAGHGRVIDETIQADGREGLQSILGYAGHAPGDRVAEILQSLGHDAVSSPVYGGTERWLMALDPSIIRQPTKNGQVPLLASLLGQNTLAQFSRRRE